MSEYGISINIGFLWFGQMREALEEYSFYNSSISWREGKGILDKTFYVKGDFDTIEEIYDRFYRWSTQPEEID